jgi:hypothetical protein
MTSISAHYQGLTLKSKAAPNRQIFVQVRTCGTPHCAVVLDSSINPAGLEFLKLNVIQPLAFTGWYPQHATRPCSGVDGRCACAGEFA